ncbi:excalibur calcium-binding domain-containing protein [Luteipulveratus mongoliensis]|uniref:excalibur calcium-binding domain-containing protein n=1 Tax=Luteipulveratus mongoliensis TaxID=571913 RepID=UPI0006982EC6|nr:excalibur calcium-binding domain-containing protein [Luteipulveratus mongoliensis]
MTQTPQAGWYADPQDTRWVRYWDGARWTEHVRPWTPLPSAAPVVRTEFAAAANGAVLAPRPWYQRKMTYVVAGLLLIGFVAAVGNGADDNGPAQAAPLGTATGADATSASPTAPTSTPSSAIADEQATQSVPLAPTTKAASAPKKTPPRTATATSPRTLTPRKTAPVAPRTSTSRATKPRTLVGGSVYYKNCDAVRAAGKAPLHAGEPGYRLKLDRDRDGIACDRASG